MDNSQTKEEGEISDDEEKSRASTVVSTRTPQHDQSQARVIDTHQLSRNAYRPVLPRQEPFLFSNPNSVQPRFRYLPSPSHIVPRPNHQEHSFKSKQADRASVMVKNNFNNQSYRRPQDFSRPPAMLPSESPSSKIWANRKLRSSKDRRQSQKGEVDSYMSLLQEYKDIKGKLESIQKQEEILNKTEADKNSTGDNEIASIQSPDRNNDGGSPCLNIETDVPVIPLEEQEDKQQETTVEIPGDDEDDDDDEDLDMLELRRNALASLLGDGRDDTESVPSNTSASIQNEDSKKEGSRENSKTGDTPSSSARPSNSLQRSQRSSNDARPLRHHRAIRSRTPAIQPRTRLYTDRRTSFHRSNDKFSRRTSTGSRYKPASVSSRSRSSQASTFQRSSAKSTSKRDNSSDRNRDSVEKTREIQKILTLDDPKEQVARFLSLIRDKSYKDVDVSVENQMGIPSKSELTKDNYEEVEMDIDSDGETPVNAKTVEELQFEPDFYNAMQPMYPSLPPTMEAYDPVTTWNMTSASYADPSLQLSVIPQHQPYSISTVGADTNNLVIPYGSTVYQDPASSYMYTDQNVPLILVEQPPLTNIVGDSSVCPPPPPPPPLPCEPPPMPPLPPLEDPPLPSETPPPIPGEEDVMNLSSDLDLRPSADLDLRHTVYVTTVSGFSGLTSSLNQYLNPQNSSDSIPTISIPNRDPNSVERDYKITSTLHQLAGYGITDDQTNQLAGNHVSISDKPERTGDNSAISIDIKHSNTMKDCDVSNIEPSNKMKESNHTESIEPSKDDETSSMTSTGEEEEAVLRAQLLKSLAIRQKEKQKLLEKAAGHSSPQNVSRSGSPSLAPNKSNKSNSYQRYRMATVPIHKPVIINLGDDSSDEEDHLHQETPSVQKYLGGLDSFLKEARKSSEAPSSAIVNKTVESTREKMLEIRKQEAAAEVRQKELKLVKDRQDIAKDQSLLKNLVTIASKYLRNVTVSEAKVKQLKEQLAAAEKVTAANKQSLEKAKKQARLVKDRLLKKKTEFEELEGNLIKSGRELYGANYKIQTSNSRIVHPTESPVKQSAVKLSGVRPEASNVIDRNMKVTISNSPKVVKKPQPIKDRVSNSPQRLNSNNTKTVAGKKLMLEEEQKRIKEKVKKEQEKIRLRKLKLEFEMKLREMNRRHLQEKTVEQEHLKQTEQLQKSTKETEMNKSVLRLEKIELGSDPIDLTDEKGDNGARRRRSLKDINPSRKPDLKMKMDCLRRSNPSSDNQFEISMPDAKAQLNILKLQKSRVDNDLKNLAYYTSGSKMTDELQALTYKPKQLTSIPVLKTVSSESTWSEPSAFAYKSPLLCFKGYRFSPYIRTKAGRLLTSRTVSNKILPKVVLCRYDLEGICNDDKCKGQHQSDYIPSEREILLDIVSYCPALAGVQKSTPAKKVTKVMGDYVDKLMSQNQGHLTIDQMCVLLVSRINEHVKNVPPHNIIFAPRLFRPRLDEKQYTKSVDSTFSKTDEESAMQQISSMLPPKIEDSCIGSEDKRYFCTDEEHSEVQNLESAVLASPNDVQLWLRLAHSKLNSPSLSPEACLDEALNVLARGLESNKGCCTIWLEYLKLYSLHKDAKDLPDMCQMAVQYAPCFDIWWKYLHSLVSYKDRNEVCTEVVDYLCSTQIVDSPNPSISHHLLETMLYKVNISIITGHYSYAKNIFQGYFVKTEGKRACQSYLTIEDKCILWLSYIHMLSWKCLPDVLWDSILSGKIVNKKNLMLPWFKPLSTEFTADQQLALLKEAINVCIYNTEDSQTLQQGLVLYKNMIQLLQNQNKLEDVLSVCRDLLQKNQTLVDIWLIVANLYAANGEIDAAIQVFTDAIDVNPLCAKVFNYAAVFGLTHNATFMKTCLEQCPLGYFTSDSNNSVDPQILYCVLLKQSLPLGCNPPEVTPEVTSVLLDEQLADLWLNYCLYLEIKRDFAGCIEMYEIALSSVTSAADVGKIWSGYLHFQNRQILKSSQNTIAVRKLNYLLHRCMNTMPVKFPIEHWPGDVRLDYSHVNLVVHEFLKCLLPEQQTQVLEMVVSKIPSNETLVLRLCEEYLLRGEDQKALSLCYPLLYDGTLNIHIWKLATTLAIRLRSHVQIQKLFQKCVKTIPFCLDLWKDFLMYQMSRGDSGRDFIQAILQYCSFLGLNVDVLLDMVKTAKT